jgi:hypothetical protein
MLFHSAKCELCQRYVFKAGDVLAFRLDPTAPVRATDQRALVSVDLKGEQPWAGVRCVCAHCVKWLAARWLTAYSPQGVRIEVTELSGLDEADAVAGELAGETGPGAELLEPDQAGELLDQVD